MITINQKIRRNENRISDFGTGDHQEWRWDWYSSSYYIASKNAVDPHGPNYGEAVFSSGGDYGGYTMCRVQRGGFLFESNRPCPVYLRCCLESSEHDMIVGSVPCAFRVVRNAK
ncbi:MAG: hypothetical protein II811_00165 [Spirochaetaceae bacterium]|nr:hypothetical protein [Spirochaetaceae bacterium]